MEKSKQGVIESAKEMIAALENLPVFGFANFLKSCMHKGDFRAMGSVDSVVEKCFMEELEMLKVALTTITFERIQEYARDGVYAVRLDDSTLIEFWYSKKECKFRFRGLMSNLLSSYINYYQG